MIDVTVPLWVYPVLVWTIAWKAVAAWRAARKGHLIWFIVFFVVNTIGILPIIYLAWFQDVDYKRKLKKKAKKKVKKFPVLSK
jgi:hypothetical protein